MKIEETAKHGNIQYVLFKERKRWKVGVALRWKGKALGGIDTLVASKDKRIAEECLLVLNDTPPAPWATWPSLVAERRKIVDAANILESVGGVK